MTQLKIASPMQRLRYITVLRPLCLLVALSALLGVSRVQAQVGDDFWFDIPELNRYHGECCVYFHVAALEQHVRVHVDMPAEKEFTSFYIDMNPSSEVKLTLAKPGGSHNPKTDTYYFPDGAWELNSPGATGSERYKDATLFYGRYSDSFDDLAGCPKTPTASGMSRGRFIENVLAWAETNTNLGDKSYVNRTNKGLHMWCEVKDTLWKDEELIKLMDWYQAEVASLNGRNADVDPTNAAHKAKWEKYKKDLTDLQAKMYEYRRKGIGGVTPLPTPFKAPTLPSTTVFYDGVGWKPSRKSVDDYKQDLISAYIEYSTSINRDLIPLKADNARGDEFFVPMETDLKTDQYQYRHAHEYSSINIVATEPETTVEIRTPNPIFARDNAMNYGGYEYKGTEETEMIEGYPFTWYKYTVYLEKAGQTCIIPPYSPNSANGYDNYQTTAGVGGEWKLKGRIFSKKRWEYSGNPRLEGTHIKTKGGKLITVITRDDLTISPNQDYAADQIVPSALYGSRYGVVKGVGSSRGGTFNEYIYVVCTEPNTTVHVKGGYIDETYKFRFVGEQKSFRIDDWRDKYVAVWTDSEVKQVPNPNYNGKNQQYINKTFYKKIGLYHLGGCSEGESWGWSQRGGALIPPLPNNPKDECIGSTIVPFTRTSGGSYIFYLNLVAWHDAARIQKAEQTLSRLTPGNKGYKEAKAELDKARGNSAILNFELQKSEVVNGVERFVPVTTADADLWEIQKKIKDPNNWTRFKGDGEAYKNWLAFQLNTDKPVSNAIRTGVPYRLVSTGNVFQLGILNGTSGSNVYYGYFSDYAQIKGRIQAERIDPNTGLVDGDANGASVISVCYGEDALLRAPGNPYYKYKWVDEKGKDLPAGLVGDVHSQYTFMRKPDKGTHDLRIQITGICDMMADDSKVTVMVGANYSPKVALPSAICVLNGQKQSEGITVEGISHVGTLSLRKWFEGKKKYDDLKDVKDSRANSSLPSARLDYGFSYSKHTPGTTGFGEPQEEKFLLKLDNGGCEKMLAFSTHVYPQIPEPTLLFDPAPRSVNSLSIPRPDLTGNKALCSPVEIAPKLRLSPQTPFPLKYYWRLPDGSFDTYAQELTLADAKANNYELKTPAVTVSNLTSEEMDYYTDVQLEDKWGVCKSPRVKKPVKIAPSPQGFIIVKPGIDGYCAPFDGAVALFETTGVVGKAPREWKWSRLEKGGGETELGKSGEPKYDLSNTPAGKYRIDLTVKNAVCQSSSSKEIEVAPAPESAQISVLSVNGNECSPVEVTGSISGIKNTSLLEWHIQDPVRGDYIFETETLVPSATPVDKQMPVRHLVNNTFSPVIYEVYAVLHNESGCTKTTNKQGIRVYPSPQVSIAADKLAFCVNAQGIPVADDGVTPANLLPVTVVPSPSAFPWMNASDHSLGRKLPYEIEWTVGAGVPQKGNKTEFDLTSVPDFLRSSDTDFDKPNSARLTVRAIWTNNKSCRDEKTVDITVYPRVDKPTISLWDPDKTNVRIDVNEAYCAPQKILFKTDTKCGQRYSWTFPADGGEEKVETFTKVMNAKGIGPQEVTVQLRVDNQWCPKTAQEADPVKIRLLPELEPNFMLRYDDRCNPVKVEITDNSYPVEDKDPASPNKTVGIIKYDWTNRDASTLVRENGRTQTHVFKQKGQYPLSLSMYYEGVRDGCTKTYPSTTSPITIEVPEDLSLKGIAKPAWIEDRDKPSSYCSPVKVKFTTQEAWAQKPYYIEWFVNGKSQTGERGATFSPTFTNDDLYGEKAYKVTMRRRIENTECRDQANHIANVGTIPVYPQPIPSSKIWETENCEPKALLLDNGSKYSDKFTWTFTPSTGSAPVELKADKVSQQRIELKNDQPDKDVTYTVRFDARQDWGGPEKTCAKQIDLPQVVVPPHIGRDFIVQVDGKDTKAMCSNKTMLFTDRTTGGSEVSSVWDFADGAKAEYTKAGQQVSHTFVNKTDKDHVFPVKVVTSRGGDCKQVETINVTVHPRVKADFLIERPKACDPQPQNYVFKNRSDVATTGPVTDWTWNFGDKTSEVKTRDVVGGHNYEADPKNGDEASTYKASLDITQTYNGGAEVCSDKHTEDVTILPKLSVEIHVEGNKNSVCGNGTLVFTARGKGGKLLTYEWNKDNKKGETLSWTFDNTSSADKTETVTVTVRNEHGCEATASKDIVVAPSVTASFRPELIAKVVNGRNIGKDCTPLHCRMINNSANADTWNWTVDGVPVNVGNENKIDPFEHIFPNPTEQEISAVVELVASKGACSDKVQQVLKVPPMVKSKFDLASGRTLKGCNPLDVKFINQSTGASSYRWDYGEPGKPNSDASFSLTGRESPDDFQFVNTSNSADRPVRVTLTALNSKGCSDESHLDMTVYPAVVASFSPANAKGCAPLDVYFRNLNHSDAYDYEWELGLGQKPSRAKVPGTPIADGSVHDGTGKVTFQDPNDPNPTDIFGVDVKLHVKLKKDANCSDMKSAHIEVYPPVSASFNLAKAYSCSPFDLSTKSNVVGYDKAPMTYEWILDGRKVVSRADRISDVGTGTDHLVFNPTVDLIQKHELKLVVKSTHLCEGKAVQEFSVYPNPKPSFKIASDNGTSCQPVHTTLTNLSKGTVDVGYIYDFGDASTNKNVGGTNPTVVGSEAKPDKSPVPQKHIFYNEDDKQQIFNPRVTLTALNTFPITNEPNLVCKASYSQEFSVFPKVKANFYIDPDLRAFCSDADIHFKSYSTGAAQYKWFSNGQVFDFGEGPRTKFENQTIKEKKYKIMLWVQSDQQCEDSTSTYITIWPTPKAKFTVNPTDMTFPDATVKVENISYPDDPDNWRHTWSFGDGKTSQEAEPHEHTYAEWGTNNFNTFTIELKIENSYCFDQTSQTIRIRPPKPQVGYRVESEEGCPPYKVQFYTSGVTLFAKAFTWDFGDGSAKSAEREPEHTFYEPGKYQVRLTAQGEGGTSEYTGFITVLQQPIPNFKILPHKQNLPHRTVRALNLTQFGEKYRWDFGDGTPLVEEDSPYHKYADPGEYTVTLYAFSDKGCEAQLPVPQAAIIRSVGDIRFPSVFRPELTTEVGGTFGNETQMNRDMDDKVFHPYISGAVKEYKLRVYNRWGEQIFESSDGEKPWLEGWNGYQNGKPCPLGVYAYRCTGSFHNGQLFDIKGNVTLLK